MGLRRTDEEALHLHLGGLLDPPDEHEIRQRLRHEPALQRRLAEIEASLREGAEPVREPWRLPSPIQLLHALVAPAPAFGDDRIRLGTRFHVHSEAPPDADSRGLVLLRRHDDTWDVVSPATAEEWVRLTELPRDEDGSLEVALNALPPSGPQAWVLAFPENDLEIDWSASPDERWLALRDGLAAGDVPAASFELDVTEA